MPTLDEIDAQIRALEDQKKQLQQKAKDDQLKKANAAIDELRKLGYSYRLVGNDRTPSTSSAGTGSRRTGIRDQVLAVVQGTKGITASEVLTKMSASDDTEKTSIRNALAALKRTNKVTLKDGSYTAV